MAVGLTSMIKVSFSESFFFFFFFLVQAPRVYIHKKQFFIKYYRTSAFPLLGVGEMKVS